MVCEFSLNLKNKKSVKFGFNGDFLWNRFVSIEISPWFVEKPWKKNVIGRSYKQGDGWVTEN